MMTHKRGDGVKLLLQVVFAVSVLAVSGSDMSDGVSVYRDPSDYALWHTATNSQFELSVGIVRYGRQSLRMVPRLVGRCR